MPRRTKPGVDWAEIERKVRAGQSTTSLAKQYDVARQSIDKRANKEGWKNGPQRWMPAIMATETAQRLANPQTNADSNLVTRGNRTPEILAQILERISLGSPLYIAAGAAGITDELFREWRKSDQSVARLVGEARQDFISRQYGNIAKASDRGDWKAAQAMLQAAPETRKDWSGNSSGSGGITVNIAIRGDGPPPVVDIAAVEDTEE